MHIIIVFMRKTMKNLVQLLAVLVLFSFSLSAQNTHPEDIIKNVKQNYVPDSRVSIYDVSHYSKDGNVFLKGRISDVQAHQALLNQLKSNNFQIIDSIRILPDKSLGEKHWGIVPLSVIYIYRRPNFGSEIVTQALLGTPIKILEKQDGWQLIQTPDQYIGWTNTRISPISRNDLSAYNQQEKAIVSRISSFIYSKPSETSQAVMEVIDGNLLVVKNRNVKRKYTEIELPNGTKGYILSKSIQTIDEWRKSMIFKGENIAETTTRFLGLPYFWGGTSSRGFDCSGFTKTVYFLYGQILPRDASQQFLVGDKINTDNDFENLQAGDLIFFGYPGNASSSSRVDHVGIYLGKKQFIHAAQQVKINSLDPNAADFESYYFKRLIGVKRIVGSDAVKANDITNHEWYK